MSPSEASKDRFDLQRFIRAQEPVYATVLDELRRGHKRSHWIWFIFPQVHGLGHSAMSRRYAIRTHEEAAAYVAHPLLSERLMECTELVLSHAEKSAHEIFGSPDDLKFRSSMTLFGAVSARLIFRTALDRLYDGNRDPATLAILAKWGP